MFKTKGGRWVKGVLNDVKKTAELLERDIPKGGVHFQKNVFWSQITLGLRPTEFRSNFNELR